MSDPDDLDRLYRLLPATYRMRDAERGFPLQALMRLMGREAQVLEDDITQLYEAWFIETCPDWVVPYLGNLVGYVPAAEAGDPENMDVSDPVARNRALVPRREVANVIAARRRKGTRALLESLARDIAGWPAQAVEFYRQLAWTQNLHHPHLNRGGTLDLGNGNRLAALGTPWNTAAHVVDVRRPNSSLTPGRFSIPSVGLFVWRLRSYPVTRSEAACLEEIGSNCFTFSALGNDTELFNRAREAPRPFDLPSPIKRRALEERLPPDLNRQPPIRSIASKNYYGLDRSIAIWAPDWPVAGAPQPVPREAIIPADLSNWSPPPPRNHIAIDPELGRIMFPGRQRPKRSVQVSYSYGFPAPIGGGEYERRLRASPGAIIYRVGRGPAGGEPSIAAALRRWRAQIPRPRAAIIEIMDSGIYTEALDIALDAGESLQIRAANRARPVIRLLDYAVDRSDTFRVRGRRGSQIILDGLLVTGRGVTIEGPDPEEHCSPEDDLCRVIIRHTTLVPGWGLKNDCEPMRPAEPSLELIGTRARIELHHSIIGSIRVIADAVASEPVRISLADSILDATGRDCEGARCEALTGPGGQTAHALVSFRRCTVFGRVRVHAIALAENSIFLGQVRVARRNVGCMRFCYVPPGSRTPTRYSCQPDKVTAKLDPPEAALEAERVRPHIMSDRYGTTDYARLADDCAIEIRRGADDESEMGVYHDLYEPQRRALLARRLSEFIPAGMDAGLIDAR